MPRIILALACLFLMTVTHTSIALSEEFIDGTWNDEERKTFYIIDSQAGIFNYIKYGYRNDRLYFPVTPADGSIIFKNKLEITDKTDKLISFKVITEPFNKSLALENGNTLYLWSNYGPKPEQINPRQIYRRIYEKQDINGIWQNGYQEKYIIDLKNKTIRAGIPIKYFTSLIEIVKQEGNIYHLTLRGVDKYRACVLDEGFLYLIDGNKFKYKLKPDVLPPEIFEAIKSNNN